VLARTDRTARIQVMYDGNRYFANPLYSGSYTSSEDEDFFVQIPLFSLKAATRYYVNILIDGVPQFEKNFPSFKTFPEKNNEGVFKLLYLTDFAVRSTVLEESDTFVSAAREKADFCFVGGDFSHDRTYSLEEKTDIYKKLYSPDTIGCETFVTKILYQMPMTHQYDDWDFGPNNSDKTSPFREYAIDAFKRCVPHYRLPQPEKGIWHRFSVGTMADFFVLDCRSQRDPNDEADGKDKSMFDGDNLMKEGQLQWLLNGLKKSTATWKIIFSSVVFNSETKFKDGWMGFETERQRILDFIENNEICNVVVLSGDLHSGGIDDGRFSGLPEMVVPAVDLEGCCSGSTPGEWSEGVYGEKGGPSCQGYGLITFNQDAETLKLEVKNDQGETVVFYEMDAWYQDDFENKR
jgi:phosphodiesterase/alkaline phosphatase D-like protein